MLLHILLDLAGTHEGSTESTFFTLRDNVWLEILTARIFSTLFSSWASFEITFLVRSLASREGTVEESWSRSIWVMLLAA